MRNWVLHMLDMRCFLHIQVEVHRRQFCTNEFGDFPGGSVVKLCLPMQKVLVGWIPPGWGTKSLPCGVSKKKGEFGVWKAKWEGDADWEINQ